MKRLYIWVVALGVTGLLGTLLGLSLARKYRAESPAQKKKLLVLGIDGMDPGSHGIFDFIHRDPATLTPYFSTSQVKPPKHNLRLGSWVIPLSEEEVLLLRHGKAFWQYLDERGISLTVFRLPSNFPPVPSNGKTFAGMGTPDLLGGYGTFSFHTDDPIFSPGPVNGGAIYPVQVAGDHIEAQLHGPVNTFRKENPELIIPFTVDRDPSEPVARFSIQDHQFVLREHEWSPWIPLTFKFIPGLKSISGNCRFPLPKNMRVNSRASSAISIPRESRRTPRLSPAAS